MQSFLVPASWLCKDSDRERALPKDHFSHKGEDRPRRDDLARPVRIWRLQHAEFVAIRVSQDVPAPSGLADGPIGYGLGTKAEKPLHLSLEITGAQVEVHPVLAVLTLGDPLQQNLGALAICWKQALIATDGNTVPDISEYTGPEFSGAVQPQAVDHDNQLAPQVRMWLTDHEPILPRRADCRLSCR
jgi:hypothetical protein